MKFTDYSDTFIGTSIILLLLMFSISSIDAVPLNSEGAPIPSKPSEEKEWYSRKQIIWASGHVTETVQERYKQMEMEAENENANNGYKEDSTKV